MWLTSLLPLEGTPGLSSPSSWWLDFLLIIVGLLVFLIPSSQLLGFKANVGLFVQWKQKWSPFIPCSYCVDRVRFLDIEFLVLLDENCWEEASSSAWEDFQLHHPLWLSGHPGVPWWHLLDLLWSQLVPYIVLFCLSFVVVAMSWEQSIVL